MFVVAVKQTLEHHLWNSTFKKALLMALRVPMAAAIVFKEVQVKWVCQCAHWPIYQVNSLRVTITVKWEHVPIYSTARSHIRSLSFPHPIESTFWCHTDFSSCSLFIQTLRHISHLLNVTQSVAVCIALNKMCVRALQYIPIFDISCWSFSAM